MQLKTNFVYDPKRQGYDTNLFKTLSGVPSVVASQLRINAASIIHYGDMYGCDMTVRVTIPAVPIAGDSRRIGLASAGLGAFVGFDISGVVFSIQANDGKGNTKSVTVDFLAAWATVPTDFEIRWRGTYADFLVGGVPVIDTTDATNKKFAATYRLNDIAVPKGPLSIYVLNANADNLDIATINAKNIQTFI